jgi:hypothetical protein
MSPRKTSRFDQTKPKGRRWKDEGPTLRLVEVPVSAGNSWTGDLTPRMVLNPVGREGVKVQPRRSPQKHNFELYVRRRRQDLMQREEKVISPQRLAEVLQTGTSLDP